MYRKLKKIHLKLVTVGGLGFVVGGRGRKCSFLFM